MKLSVIILTKNEENNIAGCLESVANLADEIIVIDDYSEDNTIGIIRRQKAENRKQNINIFKRNLNSDFATQRNFGLSKANNDWVLFIDADERLSPALRAEIINNKSIIDNYFNGFYLKRRDFFGGKELKHGETAKTKLLRLGRKDAGIWQRKVHETWEVNGRIGVLDNYLIHYPHQTVSEYFLEVNYYSTIHAKALFQERSKPSAIRIIINPLAKFVQNYFFRLGFLDGMPGLVVALMMSFHSFLARGKLYLVHEKNN